MRELARGASGNGQHGSGLVSIAQVLDRVRELVLDQWANGRTPKLVAVHPSVYRMIMECKDYELRRSLPVGLMGLEIVSADHVPWDEPEVW